MISNTFSANQSQIKSEAFIGRGTEVHINDPGRMTKMDAMPIYIRVYMIQSFINLLL